MRQFKRRIDVVVYTMGKVASSTVSSSINTTTDLYCLDVHFLDKERLLTRYRISFEDPDLEIIPAHLLDSVLVLNAMKRQGKIRIISLIRNPIKRNISAVFQNLPKRLADNPDAVLSRLQKYAVRTPDEWVQKDFIPVTGINLFTEKVDSTADHFYFSNERVEVLLLKLEIEDDRKTELISNFLDQEVVIQRTNEAKDKWYYDTYRKFLDNPRAIRSTFLKECLELEYCQKFYSEEERARFLSEFQ